MKTLTLDVTEIQVESWQAGDLPLVDDTPTTTVLTSHRTCTC